MTKANDHREDYLDVVKDPVARVVLGQHETRIQSLEVYLHIGIGLGAGGVTILAGIFTVLLFKG